MYARVVGGWVVGGGLCGLEVCGARAGRCLAPQPPLPQPGRPLSSTRACDAMHVRTGTPAWATLVRAILVRATPRTPDPGLASWRPQGTLRLETPSTPPSTSCTCSSSGLCSRCSSTKHRTRPSTPGWGARTLSGTQCTPRPGPCTRTLYRVVFPVHPCTLHPCTLHPCTGAAHRCCSTGVARPCSNAHPPQSVPLCRPVPRPPKGSPWAWA